MIDNPSHSHKICYCLTGLDKNGILTHVSVMMDSKYNRKY